MDFCSVAEIKTRWLHNKHSPLQTKNTKHRKTFSFDDIETKQLKTKAFKTRVLDICAEYCWNHKNVRKNRLLPVPSRSRCPHRLWFSIIHRKQRFRQTFASRCSYESLIKQFLWCADLSQYAFWRLDGNGYAPACEDLFDTMYLDDLARDLVYTSTSKINK